MISLHNEDTEQGALAAPLTPLLHDAMVGWDLLQKRYGVLLRLVDTVLGVAPNCDRYLGRSGRRRSAPTTSWCPTC